MSPLFLLAAIVALFMGYWIYRQLSERRQLARQRKKVDKKTSKSSSLPSKATGNEVASSSERRRANSAPNSLPHAQSSPETRMVHPAGRVSGIRKVELSTGPLLISMDSPWTKTDGAHIIFFSLVDAILDLDVSVREQRDHGELRFPLEFTNALRPIHEQCL